MAQNVERALEIAQQTCAKAGVRLTEKRQNVLQIMLAAHAPLSAYEVVDHYKQQFHESIPAMSAYRMLNFLLQEGFVHKLETTNQFIACSHIACNHAHEIPQFLICDRCHNVQEIGVRKQIMTELKASVESNGFSMGSQQLELHGLCASCRSTEA